MTERTTELAEAELRPLLFSIAYRMLGTVGDAEDVVQDVGGEQAADPRLAVDGTGKPAGLAAAVAREHDVGGEHLNEALDVTALEGFEESSDELLTALVVGLGARLALIDPRWPIPCRCRSSTSSHTSASRYTSPCLLV